MSLTWNQLPEEVRKDIEKDTQRELDYLRKRAENAFVRKSRTLTVMNAGGIIGVVSYLGTVFFESGIVLSTEHKDLFGANVSTTWQLKCKIQR